MPPAAGHLKGPHQAQAERVQNSILLLWRHLLRTQRSCINLALALLLTIPILVSPLSGTTIINFSDELLDLGLSVSPLGTATMDGTSVNFPITSGNVESGSLPDEIEHEGSGVELSDGLNTLQLLNPLINTVTGRVFALTIANGVSEGTPSVFIIGDGLSLTFSLPTVAIAAAAFGIDDDVFAGVNVGTATIDVGSNNAEAIPEPSSLLLMLSGLGMVLAGRKRLRKAA
jgi:hypothetical protein